MGRTDTRLCPIMRQHWCIPDSSTIEHTAWHAWYGPGTSRTSSSHDSHYRFHVGATGHAHMWLASCFITHACGLQHVAHMSGMQHVAHLAAAQGSDFIRNLIQALERDNLQATNWRVQGKHMNQRWRSVSCEYAKLWWHCLGCDMQLRLSCGIWICCVWIWIS